jgi:hypothetical protein
MNERIKELAKQSLPEFYLTNCPSALEKFAELIVQECMNVLHENELWNRHISHVLKEHFGVEE